MGCCRRIALCVDAAIAWGCADAVVDDAVHVKVQVVDFGGRVVTQGGIDEGVALADVAVELWNSCMGV